MGTSHDAPPTQRRRRLGARDPAHWPGGRCDLTLRADESNVKQPEQFFHLPQGFHSGLPPDRRLKLPVLVAVSPKAARSDVAVPPTGAQSLSRGAGLEQYRLLTGGVALVIARDPRGV